MSVVTSFAPSPTGRLHIGNLYTAVRNWLWALKSDGRFLLRLDDTDAARSTAAFADAIRADLDWMGMTPDLEVRQSDRFDLYEARFAALQAAGRVYPAYESPQELELKRKVQLGRGLPPVYDRAALHLSEAERAALEASGARPHWRFRLDEARPIAWDDAVRGPQRFDAAHLGDPVVRRADGSWLYLLPSVIDDIEMGITDVVRGEDHVSNTAAQVQMFEALGAPMPRFAHMALLTGDEGKLSKRMGSLGVDAFRAGGIEPAALIALLARIGTSDPVEPIADPRLLAETMDFARFVRAPARFDEGELAQLSARIVHMLPHDAVADRVPVEIGAAEWTAIRGNLSTVAEAGEWAAVIHGAIDLPPCDATDRDLLDAAARIAATLDWDAATWLSLTAALKAETGRAGKALFLPLRRALTGRDHGPDMAALLVLIGRERALMRLRASAAA